MKVLLASTIAAAMAASSAMAGNVELMLLDRELSGLDLEQFSTNEGDAPLVVIWDIEGTGASTAGFDAWDRDANGMVTTDELTAGPAIMAMAGDGSGVMTQDQAVGRAGAFVMRDVDGDGVISRAEFEAGHFDAID